MYVFQGFKIVINLLFYVFLNLSFKLRRVDFYYLGPIATTILMLNLKVNLKYIKKWVLNKKIYVLYCRNNTRNYLILIPVPAKETSPG